MSKQLAERLFEAEVALRSAAVDYAANKTYANSAVLRAVAIAFARLVDRVNARETAEPHPAVAT